jgi:hypothetical protein
VNFTPLTRGRREIHGPFNWEAVLDAAQSFSGS